MQVALGQHRFDVTHRALVMGMLHLDSNSDGGQPGATDRLVRTADALVTAGADSIGLESAGLGADGAEAPPAELLDRMAPIVVSLRERFDVAICVDTVHGSIVEACLSAGADVGRDISGFADPTYLPACAAAGASLIAVHSPPPRRTPPVSNRDARSNSPADDGSDPQLIELSAAANHELSNLAQRALDAGVAGDQIVLDAGVGLCETASHATQLLRSTHDLVDHGHAVCLSAPRPTCWTDTTHPDLAEAGDAEVAAQALAIALGCRVLRSNDVKRSRRTADTMAAILEARPRSQAEAA